MLHKINKALLLNNMWWVQALDNELEIIHTLFTPVWDTLRVSHSLVCLEGGAKEPSVDDFLLRAAEVS